jgi:short-subunit dehydrogenase
VVELTFSLLPAMIERGRGGIINVSSIAGFQPIPYAALYSATKSFLTTFSMAIREELRSSGVKVVTVCPGRLRVDPEEEESQEQRQKVPGGEQGHEEVVRETLKKLDSGGGLVIPGRVNRLTVRAQRLIPPNAVPKIVAKMSRP